MEWVGEGCIQIIQTSLVALVGLKGPGDRHWLTGSRTMACDLAVGELMSQFKFQTYDK